MVYGWPSCSKKSSNNPEKIQRGMTHLPWTKDFVDHKSIHLLIRGRQCNLNGTIAQ